MRPADPKPDAFLTVAECAAIVRLTKPDPILAAIARGELAAVDVSTSRGRPTWRIRRADFDAFLEGRRATPPAPVEKRRTRRKREEPGQVQYF